MRSKRAQMELLGLAIIMVIIIMGIMLALRFFYLNVQENPAQAARDVQLGANLLDTMLETTMDCRDVPLSVLLKDCAEQPPTGSFQCDDVRVPPTTGTLFIPGGNSCQHVNATIQYLLNNTLSKWGRKYEFYIEVAEGEPPLAGISVKNPPSGCESGFQKITRPRPLGRETVTLVLKLCQ